MFSEQTENNDLNDFFWAINFTTDNTNGKNKTHLIRQHTYNKYLRFIC